MIEVVKEEETHSDPKIKDADWKEGARSSNISQYQCMNMPMRAFNLLME